MKFSRGWWQRFQSDRGMRWKKICSNRKSFTNNHVEEERKRLRAIMTSFQPNQTWNFDESLFHPEFNGSYSVQTPDVTNVPTGNQKRRLTMASFISASGETLHPTFLDKCLNRKLQKIKPKSEFVGTYVYGKGKVKKFRRRSYEQFDIYTGTSWVNSEGFEIFRVSVAQETQI